MSETPSVQEMAQRLQREAHRIELGRADAREAERVQERVHTLRGAVGNLASLATTARFLRDKTGISVDLSSLSHGYKELAKHADGGIPSNQAFVYAQRRIEATINTLAAQVQAAWQQWAEGKIAALEFGRIATLNRTQQAAAHDRMKSLKAAAASFPAAATITEFINVYELLAEDLEQAPDAPADLLELLTRLDGGGTTLADVTDAQIALLRTHHLDQQIELKRKPS
jgi:hypothetical protein